MKKVTKFEADDGSVFDTDAQALAHDELCLLEQWYEDNKLYCGPAGCRIDWDDLLEWFKDNKSWQKQFKMMKDLKGKVELAALSSKGISFISDVYLPEKIKKKDYIK